MSYRIDGKALSAWANERINAEETKHKANVLAHFYCNLVFSFIEYDYSGKGRIKTGRTRYSIRKYLAEKKAPSKFSGSLFSQYVSDLIANGMAFLEADGTVTLVVPEDLIVKGEHEKTAAAARFLIKAAINGIDVAEFKATDLTADDLVEAVQAIQQIIPSLTRHSKEGIRDLIHTALTQKGVAV